MSEIFTPEQVAEYLQVSRETVCRYMRDGKLVASRPGRACRVPKRSVDLLLSATRTRANVTLREYTGQEIADFIERDQLDTGIAHLPGDGAQDRRKVHRALAYSFGTGYPQRMRRSA